MAVGISEYKLPLCDAILCRFREFAERKEITRTKQRRNECIQLAVKKRESGGEKSQDSTYETSRVVDNLLNEYTEGEETHYCGSYIYFFSSGCIQRSKQQVYDMVGM